MKDFYDLWVLSGSLSFSGNTLLRAVRATFKYRETALLSDLPVGLTEVFSRDRQKQAQWDGFRRRLGGANLSVELPDVVSRLRGFLWPVLHAASGSERFDGVWDPQGVWKTAGKG